MITFNKLIPFMSIWAAIVYFIGGHFSSDKTTTVSEPNTLHQFMQNPVVFGACLVGYFALVIFIKRKQYKNGEAL